MKLILRYKYLFAVTAVAVLGFSAAIRLHAAPADRPDKAQFLTQLVSYMIDQWHYAPKAIDDSLSVAVFDGYLGTLDFGKRYFTKGTPDLEKYPLRYRRPDTGR